MKRLALLSVLALSASSYAQEAGYAIHVDFHTREVSRAAIVSIGTLKNTPFFGDLDVSAVISLESQMSLGVGVGTSFAFGDNLRFGFGLSYLDPSGTFQPHFGSYIRVSWKF